MTIYQRAPDSVYDILLIVVDQYHADLKKAGVTVDVLMASNDNGPALKKNGYPCFALIKIHGLKDRAKGLRDAELLIDDRRWRRASKQTRIAVIDHELHHLELMGGVDDLRRPKLAIRPHDMQIGVFHAVAERHGKHSVEVQQAAELMAMHWSQTALNLPMPEPEATA